jgi:tryptophan synthase alpha chain
VSRAPGTARSVTPGDGETAPREPAGAVRDAVRSAAADGPALAAFLTAGFPEPDRFVDTLRSVASEADVVEVGVPFSDPMADGLTIQRASRAALEAGVTLPWILEGIRSARPAAPVLLMSYLNPLLARGLGTLAEEAAAAGVGGLIVPDLPWEESGELREAVEPRGLGLVQMVTPVTPPDRLATLCAASRGFVYAVTRTGITGAAVDVAPVLSFLDRVRELSPVPVLAGFGVRGPEQVRALADHADGVIVGSALVETLERGEDPVAFLRSLRPTREELR